MFFRSRNISTDFSRIETCSFAKYEYKLLKLVKNPNLVNLNLLPDSNYLQLLYSKDIAERHSRIPAKIEAYNKKIEILNKLQHKQ